MTNKKSKILNVRLTEVEHALLQREAVMAGIQKSELARRKIAGQSMASQKWVRIVYPKEMDAVCQELEKIRSGLEAIAVSVRYGSVPSVLQVLNKSLSEISALEKTVRQYMQQLPALELPSDLPAGNDKRPAEDLDIPSFLLKTTNEPG
jgi:hypothetical protein